MTSRDRLLAALHGERPDHVPLAFMIFQALRAPPGADWAGRLAAQAALGLDVVADISGTVRDRRGDCPDLPGMPVRLAADCRIREWREHPAGARYPVLHKAYDTARGTLSLSVDQTEDWPHGDHIPLFSDFIEPRARQPLITSAADVALLRHLLAPPQADDIVACRTAWAAAKAHALRQGYLVSAGWGVGADALAWVYGSDRAALLAYDDPDLLAELLALFHDFNRQRMELMLAAGPDLFVRRAWYEGTAFWSPTLFRRFLLPGLRREVELAHQAGVAYAYILSQGGLQFASLLREAGIDVLVGVDPVQDKGMDLAKLRAAVGPRMCLWGGINGFVTVERGTAAEVRAALDQALATLGPAGLILSPVDNVRDPGDHAWSNVLALIAAWRAKW